MTGHHKDDLLTQMTT